MVTAIGKKNHTLSVYDFLFYGFLIIYAGIILYVSKELNIWEDEAYTLHTTSFGVMGVIKKSYSFEWQPPVYFVLLSLWRHISADIFFTRLFSVLSVAAAAWFFYKIARLIAGVSTSRWLLIIFLLNPFAVWAALEIRLYAFLMLLATMAIYYFFLFFNDGKKKDLYIFLLITLLGLYTQYFFALLVAGLSVSLLLYKGWKPFFQFCLYLIPVVLLFVPNLFFLSNQFSMYQVKGDSLFSKFSILLYTPQDFLLALQMFPFDSKIKWAFKIGIAFLLVYAYVGVYKKNKAEQDPSLVRLNIIILAACLVVILYFFAILATSLVFIPRYMTIGFPLVVLILIAFKELKPLHQHITYGVISIYFVYLFVLNYRYQVKDYDYKSITAFVKKIERKGEPVLFYNNVISLPFMQYYSGVNVLRPLPDSTTFDENYMKNIKDTVVLKTALEKINTASGSYLLISNDTAKVELNLNMNREMVNQYLSTHYLISYDTMYFGHSKGRYLRIRRLEKNK